MNTASNMFHPKEYFNPNSLAEALDLKSRYNEKARYIAGGTDLLNTEGPQVEVIIDINSLGLNYSKVEGKKIKIGVTRTFAEIAEDPILLKSPYNILCEAARKMGTPQIRNMATIGGNICNSSPCADSASPLLALDATVKISGTKGERTLAIMDFFLDAGICALKRDEILTEIQLPIFDRVSESIFVKEARVLTGDLSLVNTAVCLCLDGKGLCREARIALGAVAPVPMRARKAEKLLQGKLPKNELLTKVAEQAAQEIKPINDVRASAGYRKILCRVIVERALKEIRNRLLS